MTMSPRPSISAGSSSSRETGTKTTLTFRWPFRHRLVQLGFEQPALVGGRAALGALVDEVERAVVGRQHPDRAALLHPVQIAGPLGEDGREVQPGPALLRRRLRAGPHRRTDERNSHDNAQQGSCVRRME